MVRLFPAPLLLLLAALGMPTLSQPAETAQTSTSEVAMSEDARRMHEQLVALSNGKDSISELRIELMDGGPWAHESVTIEAGTLTSKEWKSPGSPMIHREGSVSDARLTELVRQLIEKRYWTFQGTRFVPDAPVFLFRFYYGDLEPVDFRCESEEIESSTQRREVREIFRQFVSETEMTPVPEEP